MFDNANTVFVKAAWMVNRAFLNVRLGCSMVYVCEPFNPNRLLFGWG